MRAVLTIAQSAVIHPGGSMSMLQSGIGRLLVQEIPGDVSVTAVGLVATDEGDVGAHQAVFRVLDSDDHLLLEQRSEPPPVVGEGVQLLHMVAATRFPVRSEGQYRFTLEIDNREMAQTSLRIQQRQPAPEVQR